MLLEKSVLNELVCVAGNVITSMDILHQFYNISPGALSIS